MMGRTHAVTGLLAGLATAPLLGLDLPATAVYATATAGYALLPDLDHPDSRATRLLPAGRWVARGVRVASRRTYLATRTRRDVRVDGDHRGLTHTLVFAAGTGIAAAAGSRVGGWVWVALIAGAGIGLAADAMGRWVVPVPVGVGVAWVAGAVPYPPGWWVGVAVGVGCATHCLGDAVTMSGCPLWWPLRVGGRRWHRVRPRYGWRLRTGGAAETAVVAPVCWVVCGLAAGWTVVAHW